MNKKAALRNDQETLLAGVNRRTPEGKPSVTDTVIGTVLGGRYAIEQLISQGSMGRIYAGRQLALDRKVAIKVIKPDLGIHEELVARFKREALAAQMLNHPNTVRIYDFGEAATGMLYLVMEYLDGETLDKVLSRETLLSPRRVVTVAAQVLGSLIEAHEAGIVHRDIKPSNIMLVPQAGARNFVKVIDFGIARNNRDLADAAATRPGATLGTPQYMSPEQLRGSPVGPTSDLYSLGHTLYELAVGRPAYKAKTLFEVAKLHLSKSEIEITPALEETTLGVVIARAARKLPADRFPTAKKMLEELTGSAESGSYAHVIQMHERRGAVGEAADNATLSRFKPVLVGDSGPSAALPEEMPSEELKSAEDGLIDPTGNRPAATGEQTRDSRRPRPVMGRLSVRRDVTGDRDWVEPTLDRPTVKQFSITDLKLDVGAGEGEEDDLDPYEAKIRRGKLKWILGIAAMLSVAALVLFLAQSTDTPAPDDPSVPEPTVALVTPEPPDGTAEALSSAEQAIGSAVVVAIPATVRLSVASEPTGATVTLGGDRICDTPCDTVLLAANDEVEITLSLDGHEPQSRLITLAEDVSLPFVLAEVPTRQRRESSTDSSSRNRRRQRDRREDPVEETPDTASGESASEESLIPVNF